MDDEFQCRVVVGLEARVFEGEDPLPGMPQPLASGGRGADVMGAPDEKGASTAPPLRTTE